jgi:hypothetical protein
MFTIVKKFTLGIFYQHRRSLGNPIHLPGQPLPVVLKSNDVPWLNAKLLHGSLVYGR